MGVLDTDLYLLRILESFQELDQFRVAISIVKNISRREGILITDFGQSFHDDLKKTFLVLLCFVELFLKDLLIFCGRTTNVQDYSG